MKTFFSTYRQKFALLLLLPLFGTMYFKIIQCDGDFSDVNENAVCINGFLIDLDQDLPLVDDLIDNCTFVELKPSFTTFFKLTYSFSQAFWNCIDQFVPTQPPNFL